MSYIKRVMYPFLLVMSICVKGIQGN